MSYGISDVAADLHFSSSVYSINRSDMLPVIKPVFDEYVIKAKSYQTKDEIYPGIMTENLTGDERLFPFIEYVVNLAWDVLYSQGYDMNLFYTNIHNMWGQHHPKFSSMEQHIHGDVSQLTGFYFIDTPEDSSGMIIHDPRAVKAYAGLPIRDGELNLASNTVFYKPVPGDLIFTNSWLPHSFVRNKSDLPYNFIHINIGVTFRPDNSQPIVV